MFGTNPIRPPVQGDGKTLDIQHIFATLQGEGPFAGWPAIFVRLGGCNLACGFCDTEFESFTPRTCEDVIGEVKKLAGSTYHLVVITGGEPLRQPIEHLCEALLAAGFQVQIETNGTLYRHLPDAVNIVCSPKNNGAGYFTLRPDLLARTNALKFIISASQDAYSNVPDVGQCGHIPIYVQPMDEQDIEKNAANLRHAVALSQRYGYRLSLQLHKIIGLE